MNGALQIGVGVLAQSSLLLLLGLLAGALLRRRGPELRAFVYQVTLTGVALGALLSVGVAGRVRPVWRVHLPMKAAIELPAREAALPAPNSGGVGAAHHLASQGPPTVGGFGAETEGQTGDRSAWVYGMLAGLWAIGTGLLLSWLLVCQWHLVQLRRGSKVVAEGPASEMLAQLSVSRNVRPPLLLTSPHVRSPFLAGIVRPAILLPASWEADFDDATLAVILAHETAHLARRDCAWTLLLRLTCAVLWVQPLLWLLGRQWEQASEEACDLLALTPDCPPKQYADCLLSLAERVLPSPAERALGAGVVLLRSSLGRRIRQVLTAGRFGPLSRPLRAGLVVLACTAALGLTFVVAGMPADAPGFSWAKAQGWDVQPVRVVDLDHGWPLLLTPPHGFAPQDVALIKSCHPDFSGHAGRLYDPKTGRPTDALRNFYAGILTAHPHFFYAEYNLANWYLAQGDQAGYWLWLRQSLRDAPCVLAGRMQYDDGKPVVGMQFGTDIDCYNSKDLKDRDGLDLDFSTVVTDAGGCYYLPVYQAVYSQRGYAWYPGLLKKRFGDVALETPGPALSGTISSGDSPSHLDKGFVADGRVGVLQTTFVRPLLQLTGPFVGETGSDNKPLLLRGNTVWVSWRPYPKAVRYTVSLDEVHIHKQGSSEEWNPITGSDPHFGKGSPLTSMRLVLSGTDPFFDRRLQYHLRVVAHATQDSDEDDNLSESEQYDFRVAQGFAPQALSKAALAQDIGPGAVVTSVTMQKDKVIAIGTAPSDVLDKVGNDSRFGKRFGLQWGGGQFGNPDAADVQTFRLTFTR